MAIDGMNVNAGGGANFDKPLNKAEDEQLKKIETIFNRLDTSGDGTIDERDNLSGMDRKLADYMKALFDKIQDVLDTACEFSMRGIKFLLNLFKGTEIENTLRNEFIQEIINTDEQLQDDPLVQHEKAQKVFNELDKNGDGVINEDDSLSEEELDKLEGIKDDFSYQIQHTQKGKFNGVDAEITYGAENQIIKVKTSATNASDAARLMGLDRYYNMQESDGSGYKDVPLYYHEVLNKHGKVMNRDCYRWDASSQSMVWECGASGGDENSGGFERIDDYYKSY